MRATLALAILAAMTSTALAGGGFDIVVPNRPGVPIIINGVDASYAVVESAMGPARNEPTVPPLYGGRPTAPPCPPPPPPPTPPPPCAPARGIVPP